MLDKFAQFLNCAPTVYHAAREISAKLTEAGFIPLKESKKWNLEMGKSYFVIREDTLLAAIRQPEQQIATSLLRASHIDSPALKIKPKPTRGSIGFSHLVDGCLESMQMGSAYLNSFFSMILP
jgi:aspartyl aminopeptidase